MKIDWKKLLLALAVPLGVGGLAALLTRDSMTVYGTLNQPPFSPPGWVFPVVWTVLYVLMGIASYLLVRSDAVKLEKNRALGLYAVQLVLNFLWPLLFFKAQAYWAAFLLLVLLWLAVFAAWRAFSRIRERAGDLLLPYLLWLTFAAYLNLGVAMLNP